MPTSQELLQASKNAKSAGDDAAAQRLFDAFKELQRAEVSAKYGLSPEEAEDAGFFENLGTGLASGFVGTLETAALGLATMQEEEAELKSRKKIKDFADKFKPEGGDKDSLTYKLSSGVGSLGAFVPTALLGKAALPAAGVIALGAGAGEASERARDYGATEEERGAASLRGAAIGATELIPLGRLAGALQIPGLPKFLDKLSGKVTPETTKGIRNKLQRMAATGVAEGAQEATAAILQNLNEAGYNPEQVMFEMGVVEEGAIGGGAGAVFQGVVDLLVPKTGKDRGDKGKIRVGERHSDETQEEFDARQERARTERGDTQLDMFSDELDDAEIAALDKEQRKNEAERKRLEDPDEVEFDMLLAEETREEKEKEEAKEQEERDRQITIDEAIEDDKKQEAVDKQQEAKDEETRERKTGIIDRKRDVGQQTKTIMGRRTIMDSVLDEDTTGDFNVIKNKFEDALATEGYRDSKTTNEENTRLKGLLRTQRKEQELLPSDSDVSTLEAEIKEKGDVGKQATRAPDTETTGDSIQGSARVVGDERADGAEESGRAVERGLDDSERDTGRSDGREAEPTFTLKSLGFKPGEKVSLEQVQKRFKEQARPKTESKKVKKPARAVQRELDADDTVPNINPETDKLRYKESGSKLITSHAELQKDIVSMQMLAGMKPAKDIGRLSQEAKKVLRKPERQRTAEERKLLAEDQKLVRGQKGTLSNINSVAKYIASFDSPMDALYTAVYEVAEGGTQMKTPKAKELGNLLSLYSDKDNMKPYVQHLGIRNAKKVLQWANKNLSKETKLQLAKRREEFSAKIKQEQEKDKTQADLTKERLVREARATKKDPDAVKRRQKRMAAAAEARQSREAEEEAGKQKLSPEQKATIQATEKFTNALNNPKTNVRNARTYQRLKTLAEKTDSPQTSLEALDGAVAKAISDAVETEASVKSLEKTKVEKGQLSKKEADKSARKRGLEKAYKKFVGKKGITRVDVIRAYNKYGEKYLLKEATESEVIEAGQKQPSPFITNEQLINALETPLTEKMNLLLLKGDLKGVLQEIASQAKAPQLKSIARALADNMGSTKVQFLNTKEINARDKDYSGEEVDGVIAGVFFHRENTIAFNEDVPLTIHTVMHEATHAAVDMVLHNNPTKPAVKFLNRLYEDAKDKLGTAYGAENVFEFVAEAMSNPQFRSHLSGMKINEANAFVMFMRHVANILRSFVGLDTKPVDRSETINLDVFDDTVTRIMAPTPEAITRLELEPSLLVKSIRRAMAPDNVRVKSKAFAKDISDYFKNFRPAVSTVKALTKIMNLQNLSDLAKLDTVGLGDTGQQLLVDIENQQGLLEQYSQGVEKVLEGYDDFTAEYGVDAKETLDRIIYNYDYGATIHQVDPTKPRSDYEGEFIDGNDLAEVWDNQQEQLDALDSDARNAVLEQFTEMRDQYKRLWSRLRKALKIELGSLGKDSDPEALAAVAKKIDRVLFSREELSVYFPLVRQGKFKVAFKFNPDNRPEALEKGFLMFENISERDAFIEDAKDNPKILNDSIKAYDTDVEMRSVYKDAPSGSFVADILEVMQKGKVDKSIQEDVLQLYVNALPETSYARSLTQRLGTFGYIQDARVAMESKGYSLASQSAKIESAASIRSTKKDILRAKDEANNPYATVIADTLINSHADFATKGAMFKGIEEYFKRANQVAFTYTLGFNISSALVNMSQIPLFAIPYLAPRYGFDNTMAAVGKAIKMMNSTNNSLMGYYDVNGEGLGATYTLKEDMKKSIRENSATKQEADSRIEELTNIIPLVKMAHLRGKLPKWNTMQELGVNERAGFLDKISHLSAYAFGVAERFNTQSTLLFTYDLTMQDINKAKESGKSYFSTLQGQEINVSALSDTQIQEMAAEEALYQTQVVNAGGRLETAAPLSKQNFGRVAFMYKSYGLQMYYSIIKSALTAVDLVFKGNKEQRKIARRQLMGIHLSAVLFAGVGGIPIYGLVSMIYDLFAEDDEDTADEVVRKFVGELGFKGPISEILGSDVAARVKLTDLLFQENRFMRDPSVEEMAGYYLGGPALSTGKRIFRGMQDFAEGETYRGFEAVTPGGLGNLLQSARYYRDDGVMTRRGDYIYEDISGAEVISKAFGFAPLDYTFQVEQNSRNKRVDRTVTDEQRKLLRKYYVALRFSDYMELAAVRQDIEKFNKKHPNVAITPESIIRSMKSHVKTSAEMYKGVTISPLMQYAIDLSNKEYKQF